jgi:hypothetical protein
MDRDRQIDLRGTYYEKLTMWEKKTKTTPQKTLGLLMEPEQVRGPKTINISLTSPMTQLIN